MKKTRHTEAQIFKILEEQQKGKKVALICREHGISQGTFYRWRSKYGGMELNEMKRLRELEDEYRRLKQMYADVSLEIAALKDVLSKKW